MGVRTTLKKMVKRLFFSSNTNVTMHSKSNPNYRTDESKKSSERGSSENLKTAAQKTKTEQSKKKEQSQREIKKSNNEQNQVQKEDKVLRHRRKAKLGLLRFISEKEGVVDLATLHTHSEMKYFIGHKSFSDLMEEMVEEEILKFDWENSLAHLTEKGRLEIEK